METIAVYWEPVIRVYGFDIRKDAALIELVFKPNTADYWGECIESLAGTGSDFIMGLAQCIDPDTIRICIAMKQEYASTCCRMLEDCSKKDYTVTIRLFEPVDILFFHGPHFQDRYGIAEAAFRVLNQEQLVLHAVGCTGTSVYMIVNGGEAELAREMLSSGFLVPGHEEINRTSQSSCLLDFKQDK